MKKRSLCNPDPAVLLQSEIQSKYNSEAQCYQRTHNASSPDERIWRHSLYTRTFRFYRDGQLIMVKIEVVRFIFAGTNHTFTFLGTLFLPYTRFSVEFIRLALSGDSCEASFYVSLDTIHRWMSRHADACPPGKDHEPGSSVRPGCML